MCFKAVVHVPLGHPETTKRPGVCECANPCLCLLIYPWSSLCVLCAFSVLSASLWWSLFETISRPVVEWKVFVLLILRRKRAMTAGNKKFP